MLVVRIVLHTIFLDPNDILLMEITETAVGVWTFSLHLQFSCRVSKFLHLSLANDKLSLLTYRHAENRAPLSVVGQQQHGRAICLINATWALSLILTPHTKGEAFSHDWHCFFSWFSCLLLHYKTHISPYYVEFIVFIFLLHGKGILWPTRPMVSVSQLQQYFGLEIHFQH